MTHTVGRKIDTVGGKRKENGKGSRYFLRKVVGRRRKFTILSI